ncbi:MAG: hypothetical protein ACKPCM_19125 [Pseudanabaena sp.]
MQSPLLRQAQQQIKNPSPNQIEIVKDRTGKPEDKKSGVNNDTGSSRKPSDRTDDFQDGSNLDEKLENREESEQADLLKGDLPCLDSKPECLKQLQELAIANSPELRAINAQIASSSDAVKLARVQGQGSFIESIQPFVSAIAPILLQNSRPLAFGEIRTSLESRLLFEALPTIISGRATSDANQTRNNQANADLAIKLAQLEKTKSEIAIAIKGKVTDAVIAFEQIKDEADLQSTIVRREEVRSKLIEISYKLGESSTIDQIARLNEFDRKKIIAAQLKTRLRSQALRIQRLCKGTESNN